MPVNITVLDINDNCPMFVNLPYYAVVSVDAQKGDLITKVSLFYRILTLCHFIDIHILDVLNWLFNLI